MLMFQSFHAAIALFSISFIAMPANTNSNATLRFRFDALMLSCLLFSLFRRHCYAAYFRRMSLMPDFRFLPPRLYARCHATTILRCRC